jgi:serine/threonine-protein kinase
VRINVVSDPPGARLFWKGKAIGTTPFVLELAPGEKHAYEMGLTGYNTRKVVIDGTKTDISVGLKPEAGAFIGQTRGKP